MSLLKKEVKFRPRLLFAPKSHQNTQKEFHLQKVLPLCNQIYRGAILKFNLNLKHLRTEDETFLGASVIAKPHQPCAAPVSAQSDL